MIQDSIVDGPGLRFVVFAQGCEQRCEGCHNAGTWESDAGVEMPVEEVVAEMLSNPLTDGLTLSGGEPFLQAADCLRLAAAASENGLNVWIYTGFIFEELVHRASADPRYSELLNLTDVIVDGPFILSERTLSLKWRGSRNQRVINVRESLKSGRVVEVEK